MSARNLDVKEAGRIRKKNSDGDILDHIPESQWLQYDETDALPDSLRFSWFDITCIVLSMVTYIFDLAMDIYVACIYYQTHNIWYFVLTLVFVIIPAGTMTAFSLRWYVMDMDNQTIERASCTKWIIRTIFLLLQIAPVLRYIDSLIYGLKSRAADKRDDRIKQKYYYTYMVTEDADASLLRLFESFLESAPQVTLQLYILIYHFRDEKPPFKSENQRLYLLLAILSSLVSLAWSLSSYHRSLRYSQPDKPNISYKGTILQFIWHFCTISSRVFALGVFASTYPIFLVPVCVAHWLAMLAWLIVQGNQECANHCEEALLNLVVAFIYVFTYFNVRDEQTRYKYLTFYLICFLENTILLLTWFFSFNVSTPEILWFRVSGTVVDYILFFVGILCMVLYYVYFHPSRQYRSKTQQSPSPPLMKEYHLAGGDNHSLQLQYAVAAHAAGASDGGVGYVPSKSRSEFLTRKGSVDLGHLSSNPHSATSSRKNVTFAQDLTKSQENVISGPHCDRDESVKSMLPWKSHHKGNHNDTDNNETPL